ncbi:MAG: hypothetical protein DRP12_01830 [Candidatus Aenigmatarchaeota archaeon]|nr:MAG: hypothetical protein DRP12_01830 [Candidatus Aenigmarchaeota archaeon]
MKGQAPVLEAVAVFGIAVAVFLLIASMLFLYRDFWSEESELKQLQLVREFLIQNAYWLSTIPGNTTASFTIPTRAGESTYLMNLSGKKVNMKSGRFDLLLTLDIPLKLFGRTLSNEGVVELKKNGNQLFIE